MCVVERRTYIHSDGRREVIETRRRCHNAIGNDLCPFVGYKTVDTARVIETRPSSRGSPSGDMVTIGRDGRPKRYTTVASTRNSYTRAPPAESRPSVDSIGLASPRSQPILQEVRPSPSTLPSQPKPLPSARHQGTISPTLPPNPFASIDPDVTAAYQRPPSFELLDSERPSYSTRRPDVSRAGPSSQRPSARTKKPGKVTIDAESASTNTSSSNPPSLPGLGNLPRVDLRPRNDSASEGVRRDDDIGRVRADSINDEVEAIRRRQRKEREEDERQAEIERNRLSRSDRYQEDRNSREGRRRHEGRSEAAKRARDSLRAEEAARERASKLEAERRESSEERKERKRREAQAVLEGVNLERRDADYHRRFNAEIAQMDREAEEAAARNQPSMGQYPPSILPPAATRRISYTYANPSPTLSARRLSVSSPTSPRGPYSPSAPTRQLPPVLHHYPSARRSDALTERGEAVIARERARAAAEMTDAMAGVRLEEDAAALRDEDEDDEMDAVIETTTKQTRYRSKHYRRERSFREQGYF